VPSASCSGHLNPATHWIRGLVGSTAGLDAFKWRKNLTPTESRTRRLIVLPANGQNYIQEYLKNASSVHFVTWSSPTGLMLVTYLEHAHTACHDLHQHHLLTALPDTCTVLKPGL
jgi:hypothetical protein